MKKQLINEVRRFQEIAGINKEMRVGPGGNIESEEEIVKRAFSTRSNSLSKIINALHKDPSYVRAKEALKLWIKDIAQELGIDVDSIPVNHLAFTGRFKALEALPIIRQIFVDLLNKDLTEDDYDTGTPSGDTDSMNIAEDDFSSTMDAVENDPVV